MAEPPNPHSAAEPSMEDILASIRRILNDDTPARDASAAVEEEVLVLDTTMLVKPANDQLPGQDGAERTSAEPKVSDIRPPDAKAADGKKADAKKSDARKADSKLATPKVADVKAATSEPPDSTVQALTGAPATAPATPQPPVEVPTVSTPDILEPHQPIAETAKEISIMADNFDAAAPASPTTPEGLMSPDNLLPSRSTPAESLLAPQTRSATEAALNGLVSKIADERAPSIYRGGPTLEDLVREEIRPVLKTWLDNQLPGLVERLVRTEIERLTSRL